MLVQACRQPKSFHLYNTGWHDDDLHYNHYNTAQDVVELLDLQKDNLEELYLDPDEQRFRETSDYHIVSLSHFASLKRLGTTPHVWSHRMRGETIDEGEERLQDELDLAERLPRSIETLIFPPGDSRSTMLPSQICKLVETRDQLLPNLWKLAVCSGGPLVDHKYDSMIRVSNDDSSLDFEIIPEATPRGGYTSTIFQHPTDSSSQPGAHWAGTKYALRR
ncbi:hypothetical protein CC80DRAFT_426174 [Byssothecium circinans]|uniref:Uncharacterized protein n=1 Tax=Byssothecium circinans TaxID=147558 RepID=A0A6A5TDF6_9PLEO|nr:hypothetical protein CC80DRAFT_426174 [Byssothecium circinans]